jgi:tetratricopeptide (TPR) repeat protein
MPKRKQTGFLHAPRLMIAGLVLAGIAAYHNSFSGAMLLDDESSIVQDQGIRRLWPLTDYLAAPRPVLRLSMALNYAGGGLDVAGYHLVNLAIHLLAGLTLFGIIRRTLLLPRFRHAFDQQAASLAFVIALLWLVHPLQTGSVTYIVQRAESLMGLLYLLALYGLIRGAQAPRAWLWYGGSILAFSLGVATKEVMVTAPAVLLLYDRIFLLPSWREVFRRRWAFYTLPYLPGLVWLFVRLLPVLTPASLTATGAAAAASAGMNVEGLTPWMYARTQPEIILHYLRLVFWPHPLILNYEWPVARDLTPIALSFLAVGVLLAASLWAAVRHAPVGFAGLSFFLILAPTSTVIPIQDLAFEHRMYLPLACVITLAVFGVRHLGERLRIRPRGLGVLAVAAALMLTARTIARNEVYHSPYAMWSSILERYPRNYRALVNMGTAYYRAQNLQEALAYYLKAIEVQSDEPSLLYNLGMTLQKLNRPDEADAVYERALQHAPPPKQASLIHNQLGLMAIARQDYDRALSHFQEAVRTDPAHAIAHKNLALIYLRRQDMDQAERHLSRAVRNRPEYADAYYWLGVVHERQNRRQEAVESYRQALRYNPQHPEARQRLEQLAPSSGS